MFKNIFVVTDFSQNSLKVLSPAVSLAAQFDGVVHLCHVDEEEQALSAHSSDDLIAFLEQVEGRRSAWLESLANEVREAGAKCDVVRLKGWASEEIINYAQDNNIDLTAISALGGQGFKTLLLGSTSANVLRNSRTPTLFVSAHCTPAEEYKVTRIMYPTDFSEISLRGVAYVARLCKEFGAHLDLFHVMKVPQYIPSLPGEPPVMLPTRLLKKMDLRFEEMVERSLQDIPEDMISCEVAVGDDEAESIAAAAVARKVDLVVIPKKGLGVLAGMVFGRVAENVAKLSPVPTILFHPDELE